MQRTGIGTARNQIQEKWLPGMGMGKLERRWQDQHTNHFPHPHSVLQCYSIRKAFLCTLRKKTTLLYESGSHGKQKVHSTRILKNINEELGVGKRN